MTATDEMMTEENWNLTPSGNEMREIVKSLHQVVEGRGSLDEVEYWLGQANDKMQYINDHCN